MTGRSTSARPPRNAAEARASHLESTFWRRLLIGGLRAVPVPLQEATIPLWATFFYPQVPHVRRALLSNLDRLSQLRDDPHAGNWRRAHLETAAFRTFVNYCRCVARTYRFYLGERPSTAEVHGAAHLRDALASGRGALLVTGHIGNWQVGPYLLARDGLPPVTVVMAEEPDRRTHRIEAALRSRRMRVAYPSHSPLLGLQLRAALARGEIVALQLDRPPARTGLRVPFLGGSTELASGPAELARLCDTPVVPVFFPVIDGQIVVHVKPQLRHQRQIDRTTAVRRLTEQLAEIYSNQVLAHPEQWYNFFDFWVDAGPGSRAAGSTRPG